MRPKIEPCHNIARSLMYNEQKVTQHQAECLCAANYLQQAPNLTVEDKLRRFERRMQLNDRVTTNLHITLNFDPSDDLTNDRMKQIAKIYMKEIGFERQPYLVYRHLDAGHPHCHIVTTHVQKDGNPIELYNLGRNQSEQARQRIEAEFCLVTAEMKQKLRQQKQEVDGIQKVVYGQRSTTRSVSAVLEHVIKACKYTSLENLNVVLRLYNVEAYRGKENTQLYQHRGLLYRVLDENGRYIGRPLKASFFDCKPTLDNLERQFALHQEHKQKWRENIRVAVAYAFHKCPDDLEQAIKDLKSDRIRMFIRRDKNGVCSDVSYMDRANCIYSGSELDDRCDHRAVQKMIERQKLRPKQTQRQTQRYRLRHEW